MDLDPRDATLGYKFDTDPKRSMIQLPPNDPVAFDTMLEKTKSKMARARTRSVVLEIHNLVRVLPYWDCYVSDTRSRQLNEHQCPLGVLPGLPALLRQLSTLRRQRSCGRCCNVLRGTARGAGWHQMRHTG